MTEAPPPIQLHDTTPGVACLSIAAFVTACAYPPSREAESAERAWDAFISLLEARGHSVSMSTHPMLRIRRRQWASMTKARRDQLIKATAYRIVSRRLPMIELGVLLAFRADGTKREAVQASYGRILAAGSRVAGQFERTHPTPDNVRAVQRETRPVLHLACAIKAELDRDGLTAWDWPALALAEGQQERIQRMVSAAETWRIAFQRPPLGAGDDSETVLGVEQMRVLL